MRVMKAARVENIPSPSETAGWPIPGWYRPVPVPAIYFGVGVCDEVRMNSTGQVIAGRFISAVDDIRTRIANIVIAQRNAHRFDRPVEQVNKYTVYIALERSANHIIGDLNVRYILYVGRTRERLDTRAEQHQQRPGRENWVLIPIFMNIPYMNDAIVLQQVLIAAFANQLHYNSRASITRSAIERVGRDFRIDSRALRDFMGRGGVGDIDTRSQAHTLGEIYASQ